MAKKTIKRKKPTPARYTSFHIRLSDEFKSWLCDYAASKHLSMASTVILSIVAAAKNDGYDSPPKR